MKDVSVISQRKGLSYEKAIESIFFVSALLMVLSVVLIFIYIFMEGVPPILKIGLGPFILGTQWTPTYTTPQYGILPMIMASLIGMMGAILVGVPIGIFTAIMLAEIAPRPVTRILKPAIELLAGIPSVVYGFFGLTVIVPFIRVQLKSPTGTGLLAMIIILAIMVIPTIVNITENSLRAVPKEYKEGSLALGASQIETIFKVTLPAAKSGILASVVLGMGRAIGETMAVIMVCGNIPKMPQSLLSTVSPMTATIAKDMSYAGPFHRSALFGIGVVLFVFIILLNLVLNLLVRKASR